MTTEEALRTGFELAVKHAVPYLDSTDSLDTCIARVHFARGWIALDSLIQELKPSVETEKAPSGQGKSDE